MNKLFRFFMYFMMPVLFGLVLSCKDDEGDTTPTPTPDPDPVEEPTITSVAPGEGAPGTEVVITGTNLEDAEVTFGDFDATVTNNTATSITTTVPDDATAGAQNITVTTEGGTATFDFTVTEAVAMPVITSFSPTSGPVGTTVTVTGTDLDLATSAMFGDVAIEDWDVNEDGTEATFTVPAGAVTGPFTLVTDAEDEIESEDFTVEEAGEPSITAISPARGIAGYQITITGENLAGVTGVTVGGEDADFTYNENDNNLTFTIPEGVAAGEDIEIEVTSAGGTATSTDFTIDDATMYPTVTEMDVMEGAVGETVTITGTNLAGATVTFTGGAEATVDATSTTETLIFTVPEDAESGPITITTAEGYYVYTEDFTVAGDGNALNQNGSFEDSDVGVIGEGDGQVTAEGWAFSGNDGTLATIEVVDDPTHTGDRALEVNVLSLGTNQWDIEVRQEGIAVTPSTDYTYSVWVMGPAGASVYFSVGNPSFTEFANTTVEMTGEWQEVTLDFTTGDADTELRTPIHFSIEGNAGQTFYLDDLQIMEAEAEAGE